MGWVLIRPDIEPLLSGVRFGKKREHMVFTHSSGEKIFVKFFHEKGVFGILRNFFFPRGKREFEISRRLREMGIMTPRCFGYGIFRTGSASVFEYVEGRTFYEEFLSSTDRISLLGMLASLLKSLKENGLLHTDLHLENLLFSGGKLILVDLHGMRQKGKLSLKEEISNMSYALSMIYPHMDEDERKFFFSFYGDESLRDMVEKRILKDKLEWIERKRKRAFRKTSIVMRDGRWCYMYGEKITDERRIWRQIKRDKKVEVLSSSGIIKKVYRSSRRLKKAWQNAVILNYMNLKIIPRVFSIRLPGLFSRGFILMEDLSERSLELDRFLDSEYDSMERRRRESFLNSFSDFISSTLAQGIVHRDLKACNLMVTQDFSFYLLDIEDIQFKRADPDDICRMLFILNTTVPKRIRVKDRLRLIFNLKGISTSEKREIRKRVCELSKGKQIVYEGKDGLRVESF